jgi:DNA-binding beta-propeller fold protein YncE
MTINKAFYKTAAGVALAASLALSGGLSATAAEMNFEHVMNIGSTGTGPGQFKYVEDFDMAINGQHILATDAAHGFVQVFDKTTGEYISRFGGKGDDDNNLTKPEGISVAPDGRIFVADYTTGDVKIYDKDYKWLETFSEYGSEPGQNIKSEFTDIYEGKYYMPEAGNHRVSVWDLQGKFLFTFGKKGTADGDMNNPESSKFSSEGKMYVADLKNDRVQVFDPTGKFLFKWGNSGNGDGQFKAPAGIAIDKDDNIYVTEIGNNRVQVFDKTGKFLTKWGKKGSGNGEFGNLHGMYCDKETGWLYIADTANNRIQVYKPSFKKTASN